MGLANLKISKPGLITPKLWNPMIDALEEAMVTSFVNGSFRRGKGGTALEGLPAYRGPSLHVMDLEEFVPDPFKLVGGIVTEVSTAMLAAVPTSAAIAGIIAGPLTAAAASGTAPGSVAGSVGALFNDALAVLGTIEDRVQTAISNINPIKTALEAHFSGPGLRQPKNGDYIYTEAVGIVYILFRQNDDGVPSGNTVFRVPFQIGEVTWVALTTFPAPDLGALVNAVAGMAITLLKALASAVVDAALQAVAAGLIALYTALQGALAAIDAVWEALGSLGELVDTLNDLINDPDTGILKRLGDHDGLLSGLRTDLESLETLVNALKAILDAAEEVEVIGADGIVNLLTVLTAEPIGPNLTKNITWIDSSTGYGKKASVLIIGPDPENNTVDIDWRAINWISQTGQMMKASILTFIDSAHEYPKEEAVSGAMELTDVEMCEDESSITKKLLIKPSE